MIQIGKIEFQRPKEPIMAEEIEHIIAMEGKELIKFAWKSLSKRKI